MKGPRAKAQDKGLRVKPRTKAQDKAQDKPRLKEKEGKKEEEMRERGEEEIRRIRGKEEKEEMPKKLSKIFRNFGGFYRTKYIWFSQTFCA